MVISNNPIHRISQVYQEHTKMDRLQKTKASTGAKDKVTLSNEGKEMQLILQQMQSAPDIRPRAEELKEAIKSGTYQVSGEQVATSMLKSWK